MILGFPVFLVIVAFVSVVFIHELGHYLVGRLCGIGASTFSIGFGPKLFSFKDSNNTEWKLCLIPLGGFVKFISNEDGSSSSPQIDKKNNTKIMPLLHQKSFESSSLFARTLTVLAGPFANFLMSAIIFTYVALVTGTMSSEPIIGNVATLPASKNLLMAGDQILSIEGRKIETFTEVYEIAANVDKSSVLDFTVLRNDIVLDLSVPYLFQPIVFHIEMFSPAMRAGLEVGDVFLEANNMIVSSFDDLKSAINASGGTPVSLKLWRNNQVIRTTITPEMRPTETRDGNLVEEMRIGVRGGPLLSPIMRTPGIFEAGLIGGKMTWYVLKTSLTGLARMIDNTISPRHLSGPVGVAKALSHSAVEGSIPFLSLLAAISAGIGLINLFPIPVLDGGHLMMYLYELVFRVPPPEMIMKLLMITGFFILFALMVFATVNDILR